MAVAVFRHYESRAAKPLLHDHAVVSIRARRPDGTWGNLSADSMLDNIVAAGTLYTLVFMEEVSKRLGWAWEPREVTPGKRPVMELAGVDRRLIGWQSTRRQQIADVMPALVADYMEVQGHPPGERAGYALDRQAADGSRSPKPAVKWSLSQLRAAWRQSAITAFGACVVYRLARQARAAAAAVWARVRPVVDVALAAVDVVAVVYVMRGAFAYRHLVAEARRHLAHTLRGRRADPGLDEEIVQLAVDGYTRPIGRGRAMTADLRSLYPREFGDQAVVRPLTRNQAASRYDRARLASAVLTARVQAERRSRRLNSRSLPPAVAPAGSPLRPGLDRRPARTTRGSRTAGRVLQGQATDLAALEDSRRLIDATARLQDSIRERAARSSRPQPAPTAAPIRPQQPGAYRPPGPSTPTGGIA